MAKAGYSTATGAAVALAVATAKTVLNVIAPAQFGIDLKKIRVAFDGTVSTAAPVLVELMKSTQAGAGSGSTAGTVNQIYGPTITAGFTSAYNYATTDPTALTLIDSFLLDPAKGLVVYDFPLGDTPDCAVSQGILIRCTAPAVVNVRATMVFERT